MNYINIKFPIIDDVDKNRGFKLTTITKDAITSNLLLLLLTNKGERYYEPDYGTNLLQYIFEPKDNLTINDIEGELKETVKKYLPEVTLTNIQFFRDVDDVGQEIKENELRVVINFTYSEDTFVEKGRLELNF